MLEVTENEKIIKMKIEMNFPQSEIFEFLQKKGYEINSFLWRYEDETFPGGWSSHETWTFTATKPGEIQEEKNIYTNVFKSEITNILKI